MNNTYGSIDVMISQTILGLERQEMIEKAQDILLEKEKAISSITSRSLAVSIALLISFSVSAHFFPDEEMTAAFLTFAVNVLISILGVAVTSVITSGYFWGIAASVGGVIGVNFFFTYPLPLQYAVENLFVYVLHQLHSLFFRLQR